MFNYLTQLIVCIFIALPSLIYVSRNNVTSQSRKHSNTVSSIYKSVVIHFYIHLHIPITHSTHLRIRFYLIIQTNFCRVSTLVRDLFICIFFIRFIRSFRIDQLHFSMLFRSKFELFDFRRIFLFSASSTFFFIILLQFFRFSLCNSISLNSCNCLHPRFSRFILGLPLSVILYLLLCRVSISYRDGPSSFLTSVLCQCCQSTPFVLFTIHYFSVFLFFPSILILSVSL